jgi:hypothetical protein
MSPLSTNPWKKKIIILHNIKEFSMTLFIY